MKDQCEKYHINEECKEGTDCKNLTACPLRHPKMCKRIVMEEHRVFKDKCAYNHNRRINSQTKEINTLHEEVKILKEEIHTLKINFKLFLSVRAEFELLEEFVKKDKEEIKQLTALNINISERIKLVEEEIRYETDDEGDSDNDPNLPHLEAKQTNGKYLKKKGQELKCCKCEHVSNTEMSLKKHINTNHSLQNIEEEERRSKEIDYHLDGIESIGDLFQI